MERWVGRVALVTGASSGIGSSVVKSLVRHGMKVVGCGRNVERIQAIADELKGEKGNLKPIRCDVSKEEEILAMFDMIKSDPNLGGVDVCINNAGLAHSEPILSGNTQKWKEMLDVNVLGLCVCTREAFKSMQERKVNDGHIFLINSLSGHRVIPSKAIHFYSASKFAVSAILEGIRNELRELKSGIRVTAISPGLVETDFSFRLFSEDKDKAKQVYSNIECLQPDDIASIVTFTLQSPPHMQVQQYIEACYNKGALYLQDLEAAELLKEEDLIHDVLVRPIQQPT